MPKRYRPVVFATKWDWDDVVNCLSEEQAEKFKRLPIRLKNKIMRTFNDDLSKAFEDAIMHDWADCMYYAIIEAGVEKGIDEITTEWKDGF